MAELAWAVGGWVFAKKYPMTRMVLQWFTGVDTDKWTCDESVRLIRCDMAREAAGIPSFLG